MGPKLLHVCQIRIIEQCTKSASNENAFILLSTFRKKSLKEWKNEKKNTLILYITCIYNNRHKNALENKRMKNSSVWAMRDQV